MNFKAYPKWNPFIRRIDGEAIPGQSLEVIIQPEGQKGMTIKPKVLNNAPETEFRWQGHLLVKGIFDGEHYFQLEEEGPQKTRFIHGENFRGILVGLILSLIGKSTASGFKAMNQALKEQAEKEH